MQLNDYTSVVIQVWHQFYKHMEIWHLRLTKRLEKENMRFHFAHRSIAWPHIHPHRPNPLFDIQKFYI